MIEFGRTAAVANCAACHGTDRRGSPPAFPSLAGIGQRMLDGQIAEVIRTGRGRMPAFPAIQGDTLKALQTYLTTGEDNADAHMKRQIMGREVVIAVTGGKLDFGPWEQVFYGEFDGRRPKRVLVKIIGE